MTGVPERTIVDRITVQQDIGTFEAYYKKVVLVLWSDGSITWERPSTSRL